MNMKRIRNISIAMVMGLGLGLTSLTGTASAASWCPPQAKNMTAGAPFASLKQYSNFKQWIPYTMNGNYFPQYGGQMNQYVPVQPKPAAPPQQQQVVPAPAPAQTQPAPAQTQPATGQQGDAASFTKQVADLVNQERAKAGLAPLQMDEALNKVATAKANDMAQNNYFSHTSPTYGSPFDMMKQFGISYQTAGENIAMGQRSPEEVMTQWMNSPGHRQNILNGSFTKIGVGYVNGYWVQTFAG